MSRDKSPKAPELPLFDLPLQGDEEDGDAADEPLPEPPPLAEPGDELSLFALDGGETTPPPAAREAEAAREAGTGEDEPEDDRDLVPAPLGDRILSGLLDLGIQLLVLGITAGGVLAMGVRVELDDWAPFALLTLVFSFLYWFIPLAFWGQTPGMAWVGNAATGLGGEPLTFGQTTLRWIGALLTLALAGLPLFLVLGGRSLTDRLSESKTVVA